MSLLLLGNRPSKTVLALFSQTWHWELLFTWPSASTRNKAVYSIHELAPPVLFILGGITLPAFLGNGYFQADGRSCRKLWSRLMWELLDLVEARHLCESYDIPSPPELKTLPFWGFFNCASSALFGFPFEAKAFWWVSRSALQQQKAQSWQ